MGATVGVVGSGGVGTELIDLLSPFAVRTIALTRDTRSVPNATISVGQAKLPILLAESDFVVLAAALTAETARMISDERLSFMRPDAWLINIARGGLVDTTRWSRRSGGDDWRCRARRHRPEPLPHDHVLWTLPNVMITPHVASTRPWVPASSPDASSRTCVVSRSGRTSSGSWTRAWATELSPAARARDVSFGFGR